MERDGIKYYTEGIHTGSSVVREQSVLEHVQHGGLSIRACSSITE